MYLKIEKDILYLIGFGFFFLLDLLFLLILLSKFRDSFFFSVDIFSGPYSLTEIIFPISPEFRIQPSRWVWYHFRRSLIRLMESGVKWYYFQSESFFFFSKTKPHLKG